MPSHIRTNMEKTMQTKMTPHKKYIQFVNAGEYGWVPVAEYCEYACITTAAAHYRIRKGIVEGRLGLNPKWVENHPVQAVCARSAMPLRKRKPRKDIGRGMKGGLK